MLSTVISVVSWIGALVVLPFALYLGLLTVFAWRKRAPPSCGEAKRLVCVVPAHNEERGIGRTVASLLAADYPPHKKRVLVVADNCSDATAKRARAAGAEVIERTDAIKRGKGFALDAAFARVLADEFAEGVIVVDADTVVATNLWRAVSARLTRGDLAMQVTNAVKNPNAGWRPALQAIAMAMINGVRSLGRERLGVSVGLRGTGMAFARSTLETVPHDAHGVVEDIEYGVRLGMHGIRVAFVPETWIASDAPVRADAAVTQRRRWEGGRLALARAQLPRLGRAALRARSLLLLDLAVDLLVPPLSYPALIVVLGCVIELTHLLAIGALSSAAPLWALSAAALALYVARGVAFSGTGARGVLALATAPAYIAWKLVVAKPWRATDRAWVRTTREG